MSQITGLLTFQFITGIAAGLWVAAGIATIANLRKYWKRKKCQHEAVANLDSLGIAICYDCKKEV